jgi:flagellar biosynthesis/type III secretory pathway M-ring protein FliF/YscJ
MWQAALLTGENGKFIRSIVIGIIILVVVIALYFLIKKGIRTGKENKSDKERMDEIESQIEPENLSFSTAEYQAMADKIYKAVKGLGTDDDAVFEVFQKMRNNSDVLKLQSVFGIKDKMDLGEWISDDMSDDEIDKINGYLRQRNISITF